MKTKQKSKNKNKGFTLIELLIVIGILAVLATMAVFVLNPQELLKRSRDAKRIREFQTIEKAINLANLDPNFDADGVFESNCAGQPNQTIFVSVPGDNGETPPSPPAGWIYMQVSELDTRKVDGNGWLPINFNAAQEYVGTILATLPVDPVNTWASGLYYTYVCGSYELETILESSHYADKAINDTGDNDSVYEVGSILTTTPERFNTPLPGGFTAVPVSSYSFENNMNDSVGTNHGTATGGISFASGVAGQAIDIDGNIGSYIDIGNSTDLEITGDLTIAMWIYPRGATLQYLLKRSGSSYLSTADQTYRIGFRGHDNNQIMIEFGNGVDGTIYESSGSVSLNTWTHIACVRNATQEYCYINGNKQNVKSHTVDMSSADNGDQTLIGNRRSSGSPAFNGKIDELKIFDTVLSTSEIQHLYSNP